MTKPKRVGELLIEQDLDHARTVWRVQRIGWVLMLLAVVAALAGAFGDGPLSHARAETTGLRIDYERIARHGAISELELELAPRPGEAVVAFGREFLEGLTIEAIVPEPREMSDRGDEVWMHFATADTSTPLRVTMELQPNQMWMRQGRVGLPGDRPISFRQFVLP